MFRVPIFTWNMLVTGILILIAFPVLFGALVMLWCDRHLGTHIFSVVGGGVPVLWQNLFWFWGHPEVYIIALPFFGVVTEVLPVFSRKPLFGYRGMIFATISIAALSTAVWAHHMFTTGTVLLPFFSLMSYFIAVPTGIKFFNWIGTMWRGSVILNTPMLFSIGFLLLFLGGGVTGIFLASPPIDFATHDTYFVVAHFHQVIFALMFGAFSAIYYWHPKFFGRMLRDGLGKISFWLMLVGSFVMLTPMYLVGLKGMPRRVAVYAATDGWTFLNRLTTLGALMIFVGVAVTLVNLVVSWRKPEFCGGNPWDANSLEWATSSPPPHHNFDSIPPIRSERPVWDANHPTTRRSIDHHLHSRHHPQRRGRRLGADNAEIPFSKAEDGDPISLGHEGRPTVIRRGRQKRRLCFKIRHSRRRHAANRWRARASVARLPRNSPKLHLGETTAWRP